MLYTQTVAPETLELLKRLESEPFMDSFSLAGGTALALYLGHRVSVDLDLFTPESFDEKQLEFSLRHIYSATYSERYDRRGEDRLYRTSV